MQRKIIMALVLVMAGLGAGAKEFPPLGGEPREYQLPSATTVALASGVRITMVPFGTIPKVMVVATVQAGNLNEGEHVWLADLTGEMLLQGAGARDSDALAAAAADLGGELAVNVGVRNTQTSIDVLSEFGSEAVALIADVVRRPALPESELMRVRSNLLKNLAIAREQPQTQADEAFRKILFGTHPYGVGLPDPEAFEALSIDHVRAFHRDNFGAARTHIYVAGQFDREQMMKAIRTQFGDWTAGAAPVSLMPPTSPVPRVTFIPRPGAPQSTVYMGIPAVDPSHEDYLPLSLMNTLLGGSFGSRITANIREDKGYTYSPRSNVVVRFGSGYWLQTADITTESTGPAINEIIKEIQLLQASPPSAQELTRSQNYRTGTFVLGNATRAGLIGQLQFLDTHGLPRSFLTDFVRKLNAITPAQVTEMARKYLKVGQMTVVVVGDPEVVPEQISTLFSADSPAT